MGRALRLGGWGVRPSRWLQLSVCLKGTTALNGADSQARGDRVSNAAGGRSLWCAYAGWLPLMARSHRLGGRGVQPSRWPRPTAEPEEDGSLQWHGLTGWGDGVFSPAGGRSLRCAYAGWLPLMARAHKPGGRGVQPS